MKSIAVLSFASLEHKAGAFYAIHNRTKQLAKNSEWRVDIYVFTPQPSFVARTLGKKQSKCASVEEFDGVKYNVIHYPYTILDHLLDSRLHIKPIIRYASLIRKISRFKNYDLIVAHSTESAFLALKLKHRFGIPYINVWHGSDINLTPFVSRYKFKLTGKVLTGAAKNIFVSKKLAETAEKAYGDIKSITIYNGVNENFYRLRDEVRLELRNRFGCAGRRVVAFVGNLVDIKNPLSLPAIFDGIKKQIPECLFWIIGIGKLKDAVYSELCQRDIDCRFWGYVDSTQMVELYNCIDLLILPSFNEGLPLVTVEAIACGCCCIGSRRGGIPEAIGVENTVEIDEYFATNMSMLAIETLNRSTATSIAPYFSWTYCAEQESKIIAKISKKADSALV